MFPNGLLAKDTSVDAGYTVLGLDYFRHVRTFQDFPMEHAGLPGADYQSDRILFGSCVRTDTTVITAPYFYCCKRKSTAFTNLSSPRYTR